MKVFDFVPEMTKDCKVTAWLQTAQESPEMNKISKHPVMIVCPGGGYGMTSDREAEPIAKAYYAAGYTTFILRYSVGEDAKNFKPLCQLASTIAHVREHADEYFIDADKVAVCGFSAGGHLACSLGTLFNEEKFLEVFNSNAHIRPDAMVLSYPVILADEYTHKGSILNVSGCEEGTEGYKWFALDQHVDKQTPPTFIWHTADDVVVPVENTLRFTTALSAAKIPFESHILPSGVHGLSTCTAEVGPKDEYNGRWMEWSIKWLDRQFDR